MIPSRHYRLHSSEMCHTPGMLRFARHAFKSTSRKEREVAIEMLVNGYGLPRIVAWGLLDGCIPYTIEGECVVFEVDTAPLGARTSARDALRAFTDEEFGMLLNEWDNNRRDHVLGFLSNARPSALVRFVKHLCDYVRGRDIGRFTSPHDADILADLMESRETRDV
jgi:hypothetical protein